MDANRVPPLWQRRVKLQGKLRKRVQDLRIPCWTSLDFVTSCRPELDLSHNESARLAVDCLLSSGMEGYQETLRTEGEVDFLSELEKKYFFENGKDIDTYAEQGADGDGSDNGSAHSLTPCPSKDWDCTAQEDRNGESESNESNVEVFLYTENRAAGLKDKIREFIRKAEKSLAVVTDHFSDVELLCDLLEASKKRFVSVHLFVDHLNLSVFRDMWQELKLQGKDFPKFSVHSVEGETYCAKTGKKLCGQVAETFIITDSIEALTGSFSFSCLSWIVHRTLAFLVKGSAVTHFLEEFERLSSCSTPVTVTGFINVPLSLPLKTSSHTNKEQPKSKVRANQTDMVRIGDWIEDGLNSHKKEKTQTSMLSSQYSRPLRQPVMQHMSMQRFTKQTLGGITVKDNSKTKGGVVHRQTKSTLQNNLAPYIHSTQNSLNPGMTGPVHSNTTLLAQNKDFNNGCYNFNSKDYCTQRQNWPTITPPGITAGINKLREERNAYQPKSNHTDVSKFTSSFMSQEKGVKQYVQSAINGAWGATYGLQTKVMSNGIKVQDQPLRHHILQSQTQIRSPPTSTSAQPKESKLFSQVTGRQPALEPKALQHVKPSSRLAWMTQNNTREGPIAQQKSFSSYDTIQNINRQTERRQFHNTSAKSLTRSRSMTERPETCKKV